MKSHCWLGMLLASFGLISLALAVVIGPSDATTQLTDRECATLNGEGCNQRCDDTAACNTSMPCSFWEKTDQETCEAAQMAEQEDSLKQWYCPTAENYTCTLSAYQVCRRDYACVWVPATEDCIKGTQVGSLSAYTACAQT